MHRLPSLARGWATRSALEPIRGVPMARRQAETLRTTGHRPWPVPREPWVMGQTWLDLLFAHWRVPAQALRRHIPPGLDLDEFDGSAWIGITPFVVRALRARLLPPLPAGARFPELNVRTYVTHDGKPGIWFFSLDAASPLAVAGARAAYRLPYFRADMAADRDGARVTYRSARTGGGAPARLQVSYEPTGELFTASPGTLEHFLTERYCLYTVDGGGRLCRGDIHHPPWPLHPAEAAFTENTMTAPLGLELPSEPLLHLARRQDVVVWRLRSV